MMDLKSRGVFAANIDVWNEWRTRVWQNKTAGQTNLFGTNTEEPLPVLKDAEPWNRIEAYKAEFDVFGFHLSGHPLDRWGPILKLVELKRRNDLVYGSELLKARHLPKQKDRWRKK